MTLKQALIFIFTLVVSVPALAKPPADDPIVFFDGYKQGWRVDSSFVTYNSEGDVVFVGYKNNEPKYIYNVDKKRFDKSYQESETLKMRSYYYGINQRTDAGLMFLQFNENTIIKSFEKYNPSFEDYRKYEKTEDWLIVIRGYKNREMHWEVLFEELYRNRPRTWKRYKFKTLFNFDYDLMMSNEGDLYIISIEDAILYKIPKSMQTKIIVREKLLYAPTAYIVNIWSKSRWCTKVTIPEEIYRYPPLQNNCLEFALKSLPKGNYDFDLSDETVIVKDRAAQKLKE